MHRHDYTSNGVRNPHHAATQPVEQPSPHTTPPPPTAPVNSPPVSAADEITNRSYSKYIKPVAFIETVLLSELISLLNFLEGSQMKT